MKVPFEVTYGGGHVEGTKVLDRFTFGGLRIQNLQFGVATLESADFSGDDVPFDGIMGLALSVSYFAILANQILTISFHQAIVSIAGPNTYRNPRCKRPH